MLNWTLRKKLLWNFNQNSNILIQEKAFESVVCKMAAILSQPPWINRAPCCPWRWILTTCALVVLRSNRKCIYIYIYFCVFPRINSTWQNWMIPSASKLPSFSTQRAKYVERAVSGFHCEAIFHNLVIQIHWLLELRPRPWVLIRDEPDNCYISGDKSWFGYPGPIFI